MGSIAGLGEKRLIAEIIRPAFAAGTAEVDIGDDAAVVSIPDGASVVVTTDKIPERLIAYGLGLMDDAQLGRYLVAANLSDLAAMGATPAALLLCLCLPPDYGLDKLRQLVQGAAAAAREFDTPIVGGDTGGGSALCLSATAIGWAPRGTSLQRSGAKPGDRLLATGMPGKFGTALAYYLVARPAGCELSAEAQRELCGALCVPSPRVAQGTFLRASGKAHACQDVSDGVAQTAHELADASGLGVQIDLGQLIAAAPSCAGEVAKRCSAGIEMVLLGPGADYELMFAAPRENCDWIVDEFRRRAWPVSIIGEFHDGERLIRDVDGTTRPLPHGWQHFSGKSDVDAIRSTYGS